jgi:hypothetical protein
MAAAGRLAYPERPALSDSGTRTKGSRRLPARAEGKRLPPGPWSFRRNEN